MAWKSKAAQKVYDRQYYLEHRAKALARAKAQRENWGKAGISQYNADYRKKKSKQVSAQKRRWRARNGARIQVYGVTYFQGNKPRICAYLKHRRQTDPRYAMEIRLRNRLSELVRKYRARKSAGTKALLGCTMPEFLQHIESRFLPGMTWENRCLWHLDHIVACAKFDLTDPEQQRRCFHYTNIQPLWGPDNLKKGAK